MDGKKHRNSRSPGLKRSEPVKVGPKKDRHLEQSEKVSHLEEIPEDREDLDYIWDNYETPNKQNPRHSSEFSTETGFNVSAALQPLQSTLETENLFRDLGFSDEEESAFVSPLVDVSIVEQELEQPVESILPTYSRISTTRKNLFHNPIDSSKDLSNMAEAREIALNRRQIKKAKAIVDDDLKSFDISEVTVEFLKNRCRIAEDQKTVVREAVFVLEDEDPSFTGSETELMAKEVMKTILEFIQKGQKRLRDLEVERSQPSETERNAKAALKAKRERVNRMYRPLVEELQELNLQVVTAEQHDAKDDHEVLQLEANQKKLISRGDLIVKEAGNVLNDALQCGISSVVEGLEIQLNEFRKNTYTLDDKIAEIRRDAGIVPEKAMKSTSLDLRTPVFHGDSSDNVDFYTFQTEWKDYTMSKGLSKSEEMKVLQKTALQGPAYTACKDMKSLDDVWKFLRESYGNPAMVFNAKIEEFKKLGKCSGTNVQKRDWAVTVQAKLAALHNLAKEYSLDNELYFSSLIPELRASLPYRLHEEMKKELQKLETVNGFPDRKVIFEKLLIFIGKFADSLRFEINDEMNVLPKADSSKKSKVEQTTKSSNRKAMSVRNSRRQSSSDSFGSSRRSPSARDSRNYSTSKYDEPTQRQRDQTGNQRSQIKSTQERDSRNQKWSDEFKSRGPELVPCKLCTYSHRYLYYCKEFQSASISQRWKTIGASKACIRCLRLDANVGLSDKEGWWKKHKKDCQSKFVCQEGRCASVKEFKQCHITMCGFHTSENSEKEEEFVRGLNPNELPRDTTLQSLRFFLSYRTMFASSPSYQSQSTVSQDGYEIIPDVDSPPIFLLQNVKVGNQELLMFYDSGCLGAALSDRASNLLKPEVLRPGPTKIDVAGGHTITLKHGDERFYLDLYGSKQRATITGIHMESITTPFLAWELQEAWSDLQESFQKENPGRTLPRVDRSVGGTEVELMLGIRYNRYFPKLVYSLPCGLGIYMSQFVSARGCQGILGGPHKSWKHYEEKGHYMNPKVFLTLEMRSYIAQESWVRLNQSKLSRLEKPREAESLQEDNSPPLCKYKHCDEHIQLEGWTVPKEWDLCHTIHNISEEEKLFNRVEASGMDIQYRCVSCRNCNKCKNGDVIEETSLKEELEQAMIEASVKLIPSEKKLEAKLPFIENPATALNCNKRVAEKVLSAQMRLYEKYPEMREDTIRSHNKLLSKGHVCSVIDLSPDEKKLMNSAPGDGYVIPWRTVYKEDSLSTPCRMVFDASCRTSSGHSLNSTLPKGQNRLPRLVELLLRFRRGKYGVASDISMAYNGIKLHASHFKYQQYLWRENLEPAAPVETMVIKTLIYGVKSAGGQTQVGIETLSEYAIENFPEHALGAERLRDDTYVDDNLTSDDNLDIVHRICRDIEYTLSLGSMNVKDFTISGQFPSEKVSADGATIGIAGYIWNPKLDEILLAIKELYLEKPKRGKLPTPVSGDLKNELRGRFTRRVLVGKVAQVFDPLGLVTPVTAKLKLDLSTLSKLKLDWDDQAPDGLLDLWVDNLSQIQELRNVSFRRAVIPLDAANTNIEIIISVDASQNIAVMCAHARILLKTGSYSTQLVMAKSRLVSELTIPKAELRAAVMGARAGFILGRNYGKHLDSITYVTDSTISLYWINQDERPLKVGVRNAVIEIRRFSSPSQWYHVDTTQNIADLGTRGAKVQDIGAESEWQVGKAWMRLERSEMPLKTAAQLTLSSEEKRIAATECKAPDFSGHVLTTYENKIEERYIFSRYVVDPCKYPWQKSLRILGCVFLFIRKLKAKVGGLPVEESQGDPEYEDIEKARRYFFLKGTREVEKFSDSKDFKSCSVIKDGIRYYTGRILDDTAEISVENTMLDLSPTSFVKPILDRFSPIAYAIMIDSHEHGVHHRNAITTLRYSLNEAYILKGRTLAEEVRGKCVWCRRFKMRLLEVEMGKIPKERITVAPAFCYSQVDLMGPFNAICEHNHRSHVKVWGVVFKCIGTSAIAVHAMPKYDTATFIMAYTRFASRFGHPKKLYPDEGGQLMKASRDMEINLLDVSKDLRAKYSVGVEYSPCPVGAHHVHGAVERSVREVRKLLTAVFRGVRLDIVSYETAFAFVANELNNLPICLGSKYKDLDHQDLLTPNRILLGRNNQRALSGFCRMEKPSRLLTQMSQVFDAWWRTWKNECIVKFIPQPPIWNKTTYQPKPGDIVIFTKDGNEHAIGQPVWTTGRVVSIETSDKDGLVRVIEIEYFNENEKKARVTRRSVRNVAVVHEEGVVELVQELNTAAGAAMKEDAKDTSAVEQQVAVSREACRCPDCKEPFLCQRHKSFFQRKPILCPYENQEFEPCQENLVKAS